MTESFTQALSLFGSVHPHFLCTTFAALWLFVLWKRCGWGVIMSRSYFTFCQSEDTDFRQTRTPKQKTGKSHKPLLRRASYSHFFCGRRRWQVPLDKQVNLSSWLFGRVWQDLSPSPPAPLIINWQVITCCQDLTSLLIYRQLPQTEETRVGPSI